MANRTYSLRTFRCLECKVEVAKRCDAQTRYCSRACSMVGIGRRARKGQYRNCARCGAAFHVRASRIHDGRRKYCSRPCWLYEQQKEKVARTCKTCAKKFFRPPSCPNIYCSRACNWADQEFTETVKARLSAANAAQQRVRINKLEKIGYQILDELNVTYKPQELFMGKFTPDATIESARLLVQFDGEYWHDRKGTSTEKRILRRVAFDRSQDAYARSLGWRVLRLWESDLHNNKDWCAEQIMHHVREHRP